MFYVLFLFLLAFSMCENARLLSGCTEMRCKKHSSVVVMMMSFISLNKKRKKGATHIVLSNWMRERKKATFIRLLLFSLLLLKFPQQVIMGFLCAEQASFKHFMVVQYFNFFGFIAYKNDQMARIFLFVAPIRLKLMRYFHYFWQQFYGPHWKPGVMCLTKRKAIVWVYFT